MVQQQLNILEELKDLTYDVSSDDGFILTGCDDAMKPTNGNAINKALRKMGYDTKTTLCGHGFRTLACSALIESGIWPEDVVGLPMSHMEKNNVRAAYTHKAKHLEQRSLMLQWWADFLDANSNGMVRPFTPINLLYSQEWLDFIKTWDILCVYNPLNTFYKI